jgi:hypothetical protein
VLRWSGSIRIARLIRQSLARVVVFSVLALLISRIITDKWKRRSWKAASAASEIFVILAIFTLSTLSRVYRSHLASSWKKLEVTRNDVPAGSGSCSEKRCDTRCVAH